jgi:hypothetical protein
MILNIFKLLKERKREKKAVRERLYHLQNIKPIQPNKYILDECTVTLTKK